MTVSVPIVAFPMYDRVGEVRRQILLYRFLQVVGVPFKFLILSLKLWFSDKIHMIAVGDTV